jgi:hypothetical protein
MEETSYQVHASRSIAQRVRALTARASYSNFVGMKWLRMTSLAAGVALASNASAFLELERPVNVVNATRGTINKLYVASAKFEGKEAPGVQVGGELKLAPGGKTQLKVKMLHGECVMHFRAETSVGEVKVYNVDICAKNATLTLSTAAAPAQ